MSLEETLAQALLDLGIDNERDRVQVRLIVEYLGTDRSRTLVRRSKDAKKPIAMFVSQAREYIPRWRWGRVFIPRGPRTGERMSGYGSPHPYFGNQKKKKRDW
jgi:radical SAM superfamily enzyme with C-terminal helix-hairpin-helix motif